jgi:hypothetical protein
MDIGDYIFFFIFILVIIGRVLSWIFKQFVVIAPDDDNAEKSSSRQPGMKDKIVEWIRSLEDRIEAKKWDSVAQTAGNEWERIKPNEYDDQIESPVPVPVKHSDTTTQKAQTKIDIVPKKRICKKGPFRRINIEKAMIHHEILSPPLSLRQENPYDRQCCQ